jgi:hypothetical protein
MNTTFREKSLWVTLLGLVAAFGLYFIAVLPTASRDVMPGQVALFVVVTALLVTTQVVGQIVVALVDRRMQVDERGRLIQLKGTRNGSYVLATGVFFALCAGVMTDGNFLFTHVLLAFWVIAQMVEIASQLYLYRRQG